MDIALIEPYFTGSHKAWAQGIQKHSRHNIRIFSLQGRHWKWRMHGGAVSLAGKFLRSGTKPDLLIATDMLDLSTFLSLTRKVTAEIPAAVYFHENQITYPWSDRDEDVTQGRDNHYGYINFTTALCADRVLFNSDFHKRSFLDSLTPFLKQFPDHRELKAVRQIQQKSRTLQLGLDLKRFDPYRNEKKNDIPVILWNHRWEYDKNPDEFFNALYHLKQNDIPFNLIVLGEHFSKFPPAFAVANRKLKDHILHWGYVDTFAEYATLLWTADIALTTSNHDFFGASVLEAMYCQCYPILPDRLVYPEHFPENAVRHHFYNDFENLLDILKRVVSNPERNLESGYHRYPERYDWSVMSKTYDKAFASMAE